MPKKSKKSKSKRLTLRQKHKVIRKVKEHHRKKAKELRKAGHKVLPLMLCMCALQQGVKGPFLNKF